MLHTKQYSAVIQKLTPHISAVINHGAGRTSLYGLKLRDGWLLQAHLGFATACVCINYIYMNMGQRKVSSLPGGNCGRGAALLVPFQHKACGKDRRRGERADGIKKEEGEKETKDGTLRNNRVKGRGE